MTQPDAADAGASGSPVVAALAVVDDTVVDGAAGAVVGVDSDGVEGAGVGTDLAEGGGGGGTTDDVLVPGSGAAPAGGSGGRPGVPFGRGSRQDASGVGSVSRSSCVRESTVSVILSRPCRSTTAGRPTRCASRVPADQASPTASGRSELIDPSRTPSA